MEIRSELRKVSRSGKPTWAVLVATLALTHILLLLSYGRYLLPDGRRLKLPNEHNALMTPSQNALLRNTLAVNVSAAPTGFLENNGSGLRNETEDDEGFVEIVDFESFEDVNDSVIVKEVAGNNESDSLFPLEKNVMQNQVQNVSLQSHQNSVLSGGSSIAAPILENSSLIVTKKVSKKKKKMRCDLPPKTVTTIDEMNRILTRHRRSSRAMVRPSSFFVYPMELLVIMYLRNYCFFQFSDRVGLLGEMRRCWLQERR